MWVALILNKWEGCTVMGRPLRQEDRNNPESLGFLEVYDYKKDAQDNYPDAVVVEIRMVSP